MSVAQLPVIFLFASKNGILSLLLGRGYDKLNFLHRWAGRAILMTTTIHGSLWIRNHLTQAPELMKGLKEGQGMAAYGTLCLIVISSLGPVRRAAYQLFFFCQYVLVRLERHPQLPLTSYAQCRGICRFLYHCVLSYVLRSSMDISARCVLCFRPSGSIFTNSPEGCISRST